MLKKLLSVILALSLIFGSTVTVFAGENTVTGENPSQLLSKEIDVEGSLGDSTTWMLSGSPNNLKLTINGEGPVTLPDLLPWEDFKDAITSIDIGEGITAISDMIGYLNLKDLSLPKSLEELPLFTDCKNLVTVTIPEKIKEIREKTFAGCTALVKVILPYGLEVIKERAFEACENLKSIDIPGTVRKIGDYAFAKCAALKEILIPESVVSFGKDVFDKCINLVKLIFEKKEDSTPSPEPQPAPSPAPQPGPDPAPQPIPSTDSQPTPEQQSEVFPFTDVAVQEGNWAYESVKYVFDHKIMTGMTSTLFGPNVVLSRGQFAVVVYRMAGNPPAPAGTPYPDVKATDWYADAASWTNAAAIITGYKDGRFGAADDITREQIAVILYRFANFFGIDTGVQADLSKYPDASRISSWAKAAMEWAVGSGLITGKGGKLLDPTGTAKRVECAAMVTRFMQKFINYTRERI